MKKTGLLRSSIWVCLLLISMLLGLNSCEQIDDLLPGGDDGDEKPVADDFVFTMSNETNSNEVFMFRMLDDGQLEEVGRFDAGGVGSGPRTDLTIGRDPLTSQDAVILSPDERFLFVVNPGSNSVTSFRLNDDHLERVSVVPSGGTFPVSIAVNPQGTLLYVLNSGGTAANILPLPGIIDDGTTGSIQGYSIGNDGSLTAIDGANQPLSGVPSLKGTIDFNPTGNLLVALEFGPVSNIISYIIGTDGIASEPNIFNTEEGEFEAAGDDPFGGEFDDSGFFHTANVELGENGPSPEQATVSTYAFDNEGNLSIVNDAIITNGTAACWLEFSPDRRFVYSVNTDNRTISGFALNSQGGLTPLTPSTIVAIAGDQGPGVGEPDGIDPLDITFSGVYAYTIIPIQGSIQIYKLSSDGLLTLQPSTVTGIPLTAQGIAATGDAGP